MINEKKLEKLLEKIHKQLELIYQHQHDKDGNIVVAHFEAIEQSDSLIYDSDPENVFKEDDE